MTQAAVAVALVLVALAVAFLLQRRREQDAPSQPARLALPSQLDRRDFEGSGIPWLVAIFTSATCASCEGVVAKARVLACSQVVVQAVEATARADLHRRYHVEAVPLTVISDNEGVVRAGFLGPVTATDLWAAVAELRSPGSSPEPGLGRPESEQP